MIRLVLTVLLATATVAAALPAVEDARRARAADVVETDAERIVRAARALVRGDDATPPGVPGARRVLTVRVPQATWRTAGVETAKLAGAPPPAANRTATDRTATLSYRVGDGAGRSVRLHVAGAALRTRDGPVVLGPGRQRVRLRLVADDGGTVVLERA